MSERENMEHLTVNAKPDGTWLTFRASNGKTATLRIESLAEKHRTPDDDGYTIIGSALRHWANDRQRERVEAQS